MKKLILIILLACSALSSNSKTSVEFLPNIEWTLNQEDRCLTYVGIVFNSDGTFCHHIYNEKSKGSYQTLFIGNWKIENGLLVINMEQIFSCCYKIKLCDNTSLIIVDEKGTELAYSKM